MMNALRLVLVFHIQSVVILWWKYPKVEILLLSASKIMIVSHRSYINSFYIDPIQSCLYHLILCTRLQWNCSIPDT